MKENEILSRRNVDSTNRCCHCMFSPAGQSRSPTVEPSSFSVTVAPQNSRHLRSEAAQARLIFLHVKVYVSSRTDMHRSAHGPLWVHFTTDAPSVWAGTPKPLLNKTAWLHRWIPFIECTGVLFFLQYWDIWRLWDALGYWGNANMFVQGSQTHSMMSFV